MMIILWIIIIQSGHRFAHVPTAQLSEHVQIYDLIESKGYLNNPNFDS